MGPPRPLVFNRVFFPQSEPLIGTMLAFGTYALGFIARPVGGVIFGHFGDRIGRKQLLMLSLVLMGIATFAIGLLPAYAQIGVWAPGLLVTLRLVQGFAVGGEWGGAVLLVAEHGPPHRRGFWASWPQVGVPIGNLLAAGLLALMSSLQSDAAFLARGWRVPFLLSAVLIVIATGCAWRSLKPRYSRPPGKASVHPCSKCCAGIAGSLPSGWGCGSPKTSPTTSSRRSRSRTSPKSSAVRYSGASVAYQVTSIFAGSLAPIIAIALLRRSGSAQPIAVYVLATCMITGSPHCSRAKRSGERSKRSMRCRLSATDVSHFHYACNLHRAN